MEALPIFFLLLLLIVAMLYSSIGHGGASGYLALMALFAVETVFMKGSALLLNLFVAGFSFYQYYRGGHFKWKLFWPFALASVPMAFIGGGIELDPTIYKKILGICLLLAVVRLSGLLGKENVNIRKLNLSIAVIIGLALGFFSGLIGIGGGIILSPIILLLGWGNMKETAAVSALFIFVNSGSGLLGMSTTGFEMHPQIYMWVVVAFLGGSIGAFSGARKLDNRILRYVLSFVLFAASVKLFFI